MEAKRGKKRALEADEGQGDEREMVGGVGEAMKGSQRGGEGDEQQMVEGLARAVQGQGQGGQARAVQPPAKRMGKSRAASSDLILNPTRCCCDAQCSCNLK